MRKSKRNAWKFGSRREDDHVWSYYSQKLMPNYRLLLMATVFIAHLKVKKTDVSEHWALLDENVRIRKRNIENIIADIGKFTWTFTR